MRKWQRTIVSKSDVEEQQQAWDEAQKTEVPTAVKPPMLSVKVRYWDGCEDVFVQVADVRGGPNGDAVMLTGPGPDICIPVRNIRFLEIDDA